MKKEIVIAGFGGQGILFSGKVLAYAGMIDGHNVSGSVVRSRKCAAVRLTATYNKRRADRLTYREQPEILIVEPALLDRFEAAAVPNGLVFIDSSLIGRKTERTDVTRFISRYKACGQNNSTGLPIS